MAFAATAMAAPPTITSWSNTKTDDQSLTIMINETECISFNASADQIIDTWQWSIDGVDQTGHNFDDFQTSWPNNGTHAVVVTAENTSNGTSSPVTWSPITVKDITSPAKVQDLENGTVTDTTVYLGWTENADLDLAGYKVYYQNGSLIDSISATDHYTVQSLSPSTTYGFTVSAYDSSGLEGAKSDGWSVTTAAAGSSPEAPDITPIEPSANPESEVDEEMTFRIKVDQDVKVTWYINETPVRGPISVASGVNETYDNDTAPEGVYNVTVFAENTSNSRSDSHKWIWTVTPRGYTTGNRIWEDGMGDPYRWTAQSFTGFYYDIDDGLSTETLTITDIGRSLDEKSIEYKTVPRSVNFDCSRWDTYDVIGFMAEKYFSGYYSGTDSDITSDTISLISNKLLS